MQERTRQECLLFGSRHCLKCATSPSQRPGPINFLRRKTSREGVQRTMYKPNFCAECGTRIERERWRMWDSRRFCDVCARRFRQRRLIVPLLTVATLLSSGFLWGRLVQAPSPLLIVERREPPTPTLALQSASTSTSSPAGTAATTAPPRYGPDGTANERPTEPSETISICGARTQKGTPCSRRVRGTGRCWQHIGKRAMLPASKLIVQG